METLGAIAAPVDPLKILVPVKDFFPYFSNHLKTFIDELLHPYQNYESEFHKIYAQQPSYEVVKDGHADLVPIFAGYEEIHAHSLATKSSEEKEKYSMPLDDVDYRPTGHPAVISSLKESQHNFHLFLYGLGKQEANPQKIKNRADGDDDQK